MIPSRRCTCLIGQDKFSANDGRPHAGFTSHGAGIWGTASGDRAENVSGIFRFLKPDTQIFDTPNPEAGTNQHAQVKFRPSELLASDGVNLEVILGYLDESHYLVAGIYNYQSGNDDPCWRLQLLARDTSAANGYYTSLKLPTGDGAAISLRGLEWDTQYVLDACLLVNNYGSYNTGDTLRAKVSTVGGTFIGGVQGVADGYTTGDQAGLALGYSNYGTGGSDNTKHGTVEFDDWKFTYFRGPTHLSCPNCNGLCPIFSDPFDYDDAELGTTNCSTCPDCFWELLTGAARISSGQLEIDSGGLVRCLAPHPTNKTSKIVTDGIIWAAGIVARVDVGTGYAQFDSTNRKILLYDNADNLLASSATNSLPVADDALHTVQVCYEGGALTATMDGVCVDAISPDTGDPFVYLGSAGGTVHFTSLVLKKHKDTSEPKDGNCERCLCETPPQPCTDCCAETPSGNYIVDLGAGGWTSIRCFDHHAGPACPDAAPVCTPCEDIQGEYVVDQIAGCTWSHVQTRFCDAEDFRCCTFAGDPQFDFSIVLTLVQDGMDTRCRWRVEVQFASEFFDPADPDLDCGRCDGAATVPITGTNNVVYYSDWLADNTRCQELPVTLSKFSESGDAPCLGTFPGTITLESAS